MKKRILLIISILFAMGQGYSQAPHCTTPGPATLADAGLQQERTGGTRQQRPAEMRRGSMNMDEIQQIMFVGTEPFWSMRINSTNAIFEPSIGEEPVIINHNKQSTNLSSAALRLDGRADQRNYSVTVRRELCHDGMSDNEYEYSIMVQVAGGGIFLGCGSRIDLQESRSQLESNLWQMIENINAQKNLTEGLLFDRDIRQFRFYKTNPHFKNYVDWLLDMGYTIVQQEGQYYLQH